jgi:DNA modification methylase
MGTGTGTNLERARTVRPFYADELVTLHHGNSIEVLRQIPDESANCCVTSPPYWSMRDYGVEGQIGLEKTPEEYVVKMVELFREVRRVLREDGILWLNLGDGYAGGGRGGNPGDSPHVKQKPNAGSIRKSFEVPSGLKTKDLVGAPWMVAFALRADGWYLRQDNVWGKPNGMPESVEDRTTRSHEYVFMLSKSEKYYYNADAVRTAPKPSTETRLKQDLENQIGSMRANGGTRDERPMKCVVRKTDKQRGHSRRHDGFNDRWDAMECDEQMYDGANLRDVWWIAPASFKAAHFAVMPEKLATICILAGCPAGGTVIDPFFGAGTTGAVAKCLHSRCIGIELNADYCEIAAERLSQAVLPFTGGEPQEVQTQTAQGVLFREGGGNG